MLVASYGVYGPVVKFHFYFKGSYLGVSDEVCCTCVSDTVWLETFKVNCGFHEFLATHKSFNPRKIRFQETRLIGRDQSNGHQSIKNLTLKNFQLYDITMLSPNEINYAFHLGSAVSFLLRAQCLFAWESQFQTPANNMEYYISKQK